MQDLQPDLGRIQAYQVKWSGIDGTKTKSPIDLIECHSLTIEKTEQVFASEYSSVRDSVNDDATYLCPDPSSSMQVAGGYFDKDFDYIEVDVVACA